MQGCVAFLFLSSRSVALGYHFAFFQSRTLETSPVDDSSLLSGVMRSGTSRGFSRGYRLATFRQLESSVLTETVVHPVDCANELPVI